MKAAFLPDRGVIKVSGEDARNFLNGLVTTDGKFEVVLKEEGVRYRERIYTPLVTLWTFLTQVLSLDHCCLKAVACLIAYRTARGLEPCSAETGAYCQARKRLPEKFFSEVARRTGRTLDDGVDARWLWKRRRVYVYDGSAVSMPDTEENQRDYPQPGTQKPGLGFTWSFFTENGNGGAARRALRTS